MKESDSVMTPVIHIFVKEINPTSAKCRNRIFCGLKSWHWVIYAKLQVTLNWNMSLMCRTRQMKFITELKTGMKTKH